MTATTVPTTSGTSTTSLTWEVSLNTPGDYYEYYVDVKNDGTIDAMIGSLSNTSLTTNQAKYLDYTVTYDDGATIEQYDKLDSGDMVTLKVRVEYKTDLNPEDLPSDLSVVVLTYTSNYVQADENAKDRNTIASLNIGDTVNYSTSMNGVTLDNWKVFSIDGDYTILILADYLPNSAIDTTSSAFSNLIKSIDAPTYGIYAKDNRKQLIDAMTTKANWENLLTGTINGIPIDYSGTTDTNIWAMGGPTLDLWINSWNTKYPDDKIYTATLDYAMSDGLYGYFVGLTENPTTQYIDLREKEGYNNTLYYPHKVSVDNCYTYWLFSPSVSGVDCLMFVDCIGSVGHGMYYVVDVAARPVISIPTSILH